MLGLIFTYALTYGGALVSLFNPFVGLLIYVAFAIIKPEAMWWWSVPHGNYSRIVAIALLIGWMLHGFGRWNFGRARAIVFALVGFWLWSVASAMNAPNEQVAWLFVENTAKVLIPFFVGITLIDSVKKLKQLAWVLMLSLGYVAYEMNLSYWEGFNRVHLMGFAGMDNNSIAIAMVVGVGLAFFLGVIEGRWWLRGLAWLATLLLAHTVLLSFSRGGMLALIITGVVSFFLLPSKQPKQMLAFIAVVLIAFRLAGPEVSERFMTTFADTQERDASAQVRVDLWEDAWDTMKSYPILGVGPDHWPLMAPEYGWKKGQEAHSLWLQTGAELGFPGVGLLGLFYTLCLARLWQVVRGKVKVNDPWLQNVGRMVIAGLVGFIIAGQFVSLEGLEVPYYITLLGVGALKLLPSPDPVHSKTRVPALGTNYTLERA